MVVTTPALLFYFGFATSNTVGFMLACLVLITLQRQQAARPGALAAGVPTSSPRRLAAIVMTATALHLLAATALVGTDLTRAMASLLPLALLLLASAALANALISVPPKAFHRSLNRCFWALVVLALLGAVGVAPPNPADWRKPVFPFSEPSMFALALNPVLLYVCVRSRAWARIVPLTIGIACGLAIQSLTLLIGCLVVAIATQRPAVLLVLAAGVVAAAAQFDPTYYSQRVNLDLASDEQNFSTLVYLQGWQMIGEALERSAGVGIGFQQLGVQRSDVPAAELLRSMREGEDLNTLDGGFVFAKLASDFGVFGVLLGLAYLGLAARSLRKLRRETFRPRRRGTMAPVHAFAHACVLTYSIELFVRGSGYFTGGSLLLAAAIWLLYRRSLRRAASRRSVDRRGEVPLVPTLVGGGPAP